MPSESCWHKIATASFLKFKAGKIHSKPTPPHKCNRSNIRLFIAQGNEISFGLPLTTLFLPLMSFSRCYLLNLTLSLSVVYPVELSNFDGAVTLKKRLAIIWFSIRKWVGNVTKLLMTVMRDYKVSDFMWRHSHDFPHEYDGGEWRCLQYRISHYYNDFQTFLMHEALQIFELQVKYCISKHWERHK